MGELDRQRVATPRPLQFDANANAPNQRRQAEAAYQS